MRAVSKKTEFAKRLKKKKKFPKFSKIVFDITNIILIIWERLVEELEKAIFS